MPTIQSHATGVPLGLHRFPKTPWKAMVSLVFLG
jgi:hypothetical protein